MIKTCAMKYAAVIVVISMLNMIKDSTYNNDTIYIYIEYIIHIYIYNPICYYIAILIFSVVALPPLPPFTSSRLWLPATSIASFR